MKHIHLLFLMAVGASVACTVSSRRAEGERCTATADCDLELECVIVDDDLAHCLPRPPERGERTCSVDTGCTLSDGELWPVEAECLDFACRCLGAEVLCGADEFNENFSTILEEETCRCVSRGGEGDDCITSHTCEPGLACTAGECRSAIEQQGSACVDSNDCSEANTCTEFRDNNDVGVCR